MIRRQSMAVLGRVAWLGALLAGGACTSQEFTVTDPGGRVQHYRRIEFRPHLDLQLNKFEVRPAGSTQDGFPIREYRRRDGRGGRFFEVTPPVGEPLFFEESPKTPVGAPSSRPGVVTDEAPRPIFEEAIRFDELRVRAELVPEFAVLEGRVEHGPWVTVSSGPLERVTLDAAARGHLPLEFDNDLGHWSIRADARFPMAVVRLHGEVVQVRGLR